MPETVISIENVSVAYTSGARALDGVTLSIARGSFVALVGSSGSGKTTLLKTINRLIEPTAGEVRFDGEPVREFDPAILRRRIGYVFQGLGLFPHMSVAENIGITPTLLDWPKGDIDARVRELLRLVSLPSDVSSRAPSALSGGQRQRVAIARALAARPPVMLMDEPFGALDPVTRDGLTTAYRAIHDDLGLTSVMVTHDMQEALLLADRIVVISAGKVVADGDPPGFLGPDAPDDIKDLIDVPRRQAERIHALGERTISHG